MCIQGAATHARRVQFVLHYMIYFYIHVYTGSGNTFNAYLYTYVNRERQHARGMCMRFLHKMMVSYILVYIGSGNKYNVNLYTCVNRERQHTRGACIPFLHNMMIFYIITWCFSIQGVATYIMYIYIRVYTGSGNTCEACAYSMFDGIHIYIHVYTGSGNTYNVYIYICRCRERQYMRGVHARQSQSICWCVHVFCIHVYACMFVYLCMCSVYACIIGNTSCLYFKG